MLEKANMQVDIRIKLEKDGLELINLGLLRNNLIF